MSQTGIIQSEAVWAGESDVPQSACQTQNPHCALTVIHRNTDVKDVKWWSLTLEYKSGPGYIGHARFVKHLR